MKRPTTALHTERTEDMFSVVERFISINGEGTRAGELAAFIRFKGCNLCCSYCDTAWANKADAYAEEYTAEELCKWALGAGVKNVTLTGGEPLLQRELKTLTDLLYDNGLSAEIETNGSVSVKELALSEKRPILTLDYKLPSSGMEDSNDTGNFAYLGAEDTVKFVSGSREDLERAVEIIDKFSLTERCRVYISPVFGRIEPAEIVDFMKEKRLNGVRLQLQLHKFIWDPQKRGV